MEDILKRLEEANEFAETMYARRLREDAACEIRSLRREKNALLEDLEKALSKKEWK